MPWLGFSVSRAHMETVIYMRKRKTQAATPYQVQLSMSRAWSIGPTSKADIVNGVSK